MQLVDQSFGLLFEVVHLGPHLVLLLQHVVTHAVESVVENLENALDFELVAIKFADQGLLLFGVDHFQGDELLLQLVWNRGENFIAHAVDMVGLALAAVELVGDLAAELDLVSVLLTVELRWVELEVVVVVQSCVLVFVGSTWLKLLETQILRRSAHEIFVKAVFGC